MAIYFEPETIFGIISHHVAIMERLEDSDHEFSIISFKMDINNKEVEEILKNSYKEVEELLTKEDELLDKLAEALLEKDELEYEDIDTICQKYGKTKVRRIEEEGLLKQFRATIGPLNSKPVITENKPKKKEEDLPE